MTLTSEKIKESNIIEQHEVELLSKLLFQNISIVSNDTKKTITHKINTLQSLKDYLLKNIEIDNLPSDSAQLNYINLLSKITEQIENFEIVIGIKDINSLKRAAKTFSRKTQFPIGFTE